MPTRLRPFVRASLVLILLTPLAVGQSLISDVEDGSLSDIAARSYVDASTPAQLWLAQGRNLARIDPTTGNRLSDDTLTPSSGFAKELIAVEYVGGTFFVATKKQVSLRLSDSTVLSLTMNLLTNEDIVDIKVVSTSNNIFVATSANKIHFLRYTSTLLEERDSPIALTGSNPTPGGFRRLEVLDYDNRRRAFVTVIYGGGVHGGAAYVAAADLSENTNDPDYDDGAEFKGIFDIAAAFGSAANAYAIQVFPNATGTTDYAYVAAGQDQTMPTHKGLLAKLNVTTLTSITGAAITDSNSSEWLDGFDVSNILKDPIQSTRLFVATINRFSYFNTTTDTPVDGTGVTTNFGKGGFRDMAHVTTTAMGSDPQVWTASQNSNMFNVNMVDVSLSLPSYDETEQVGWVYGSDGAVTFPELASVYLPTFGGVLRYDITDEMAPAFVSHSFKPTTTSPGLNALGNTEHIAALYLSPGTMTGPRLITANGWGGIELWTIDSDSQSPTYKNPISSTVKLKVPTGWNATDMRNYDVGSFRQGGVNYLLTAVQNVYSPDGLWFHVFNMSTNTWKAVHYTDSAQTSVATIDVGGHHAFCAGAGGFFVVDLGELPTQLTLTDSEAVDFNADMIYDETPGIAVRPDSGYIFLATRKSSGLTPAAARVLSYSFTPSTGEIGSLVGELVDDGSTLAGTTSRARYYNTSGTNPKYLYIAAEDGKIVKVNVTFPGSMTRVTNWNNGAYQREMQDCRVYYNSSSEPRLLAVKNFESFAILSP